MKNYVFILLTIFHCIPVLGSDNELDSSNTAKRTGTSLEKLENSAQHTKIKKSRTENLEDEEFNKPDLTINDLNDEVIIYIFSFLNPNDFFSINFVSKQWNTISNASALERFRPCKESRVATSNLAYLYKDNYFGFEEWEDTTKSIIRTMANSINKIPQFSSLNLVIAQLSIIYEDSENIKKRDFMLPHFFMSRWPDEREKDKLEETFFKAKQMHLADLKYSRFHVGNGKNFSWRGYYPQFKNHLRTIISVDAGEKSRLIPKRINRRLKQINDSDARTFSLFYSHSEQAVLIYLKDQIDVYLPELLNEINKSARISHVLLNMVSYYDMCERCGDTFFREYENGKGFTNLFNKALMSKGYVVPPYGIKFFVACAGLEKYPSDDGTVLRDSIEKRTCSISHNGKEAINLVNVNLAVAQHYIN
jgi:hypothetical protein